MPSHGTLAGMVGREVEPLPDPVEAGGWRYRFVSQLGEGGFGVVYRAVRQRDGGEQVVAVKVFHPLAPSATGLRW